MMKAPFFSHYFPKESPFPLIMSFASIQLESSAYSWKVSMLTRVFLELSHELLFSVFPILLNGYLYKNEKENT